ncbi:winged helix-turn-helix domain-containing protein [Nocardiopsis sp. CNT-189]|uniref:BTAD domain-containing putative transcriptional regulator n=1 Tax=Nocardiopsis oceanisediminis TaxID=2816862 RepID=UPI003B2DE5B6
MRFGVLGPLEVRTDAGAEVAVPGAKVRALLAALLVADGEPVSADRLLEEVWEGDPPSRGAAALQTAASRLRRALDAAEPGARALVESGPSGYRLRAPEEAVDAAGFAALLARARTAPAPGEAAALLDEALQLWRGPALADHADAAFAAPAIARLEEQRAAALEQRAEARLAAGEHASLVGELGELVSRYPLRERLRAAHMRALYRAGRQAEALESFRSFRALLAEEIGVDPGPELERLHTAILTGDAPRPARADPWREPGPPPGGEGPRPGAGQDPAGPPDGAPGNLPAPLVEAVGREKAVAEVGAALADGRLATLTGPGGVGKTTLAVAAAGAVRERFPDGVWFAELTARDACHCDVEDIAQFVAATVGLREDVEERGGAAARPRAVSDRLVRALRGKEALILLDNCEQVVESVAGLAAVLLRGAPGLRLLATSREPLGVPGEVLHPVRPLEPPAPDAPHDPERLLDSPAVRMFAGRAAAAVPGFTVHAGNAAAVAAICTRLDGLPLALELAAARLRAMDVAELADRIGDRFRLLAAPGRGGGTARHRTLRAVIDWSWELLGAGERTVLSRVSVHAGGFPLAAAEAVCSGGPVAEGEVWEVLARLVDRSLVVAEPGQGGTRYRLLESVAAYGWERLEEDGAADRVLGLHVGHWTRFAERNAGRLRGPEQAAALAALDAERANLRLALERAAARSDAESALRLAGALGRYWYLRGRNGEAQRSLRIALGVDGAAPPQVRARARMWFAAMEYLQGRPVEAGEEARAVLEAYGRMDDPAGLAEAQALFAMLLSAARGTGTGFPSAIALTEAAQAAFRRSGDDWGLALALHARGWEELRRSDLGAAREDAEESLELFRRAGDPWGEARAADLLGVLAGIAGDHEGAARLHRSAQRLAEEIGLWPQAAEEVVRLGRVALAVRDYAEAERLHAEALARAGGDHFTGLVTMARGGLGMTARRRGDLDRAERELTAVLEVHEAEGYAAGRASLLAELGFTAEQRGDAAAARRLHLRGLAASWEAHDPRAVAQALEGLAGADALDGAGEGGTARSARGARLLGAAAAARDAAGAPQPEAERFDVDRIGTALRALLGEDRFTAEFTAGAGTPLEKASAEAEAERPPEG